MSYFTVPSPASPTSPVHGVAVTVVTVSRLISSSLIWLGETDDDEAIELLVDVPGSDVAVEPVAAVTVVVTAALALAVADEPSLTGVSCVPQAENRSMAPVTSERSAILFRTLFSFSCVGGHYLRE
jgi:hypothetical protein